MSDRDILVARHILLWPKDSHFKRVNIGFQQGGGNDEAMAVRIGLDEYSSGIDEPNKKALLCGICLWTFETETELSIHNYLEHLIIEKHE